MGELFITVSADSLPRMFGYARGAGHAIRVPASMLGDPLAVGGKVGTVCGARLDVARLDEKFQGDRQCARCVKWLESDKGARAVEDACAARYEGAVDGLEGGPELGADVAPVPVAEIDARKAARDGETVNDRGTGAAVERPMDRPEVRELLSAIPSDDDGEIIGITGLTRAEVREKLVRYFANGGKVPAEIRSLPDPKVIKINWSGTNESGPEFRKCAGAGRVDVVNPEGTHGKCRECRTYFPLQDNESGELRIGSHYEYGVTPPAVPSGMRLTSKTIDTVSHGSVPGSPQDAHKRRETEALCRRSNRVRPRAKGGKIKCPECGREVTLVKGGTRKGGEVVYRYPKHIAYGDHFRTIGTGGGYVHGKTNMITYTGEIGVGSRDQGTVDGCANITAHDMPPARPDRGWVAKAGTMSLPATLRPGVDPGVQGKMCPLCQDLAAVAHKGKSRAWRRNHSRALAAYYKGRRAEQNARRQEEIQAGVRLPRGARKAARKAASTGSFAEGTVAGMVRDGKRPEEKRDGGLKGARRPASKRTPSPLEREILGKGQKAHANRSGENKKNSRKAAKYSGLGQVLKGLSANPYS